MYNSVTSDKDPIFLYPKLSKSWMPLILGILMFCFGGMMTQCSESSMTSKDLFMIRMSGWTLVGLATLVFAAFCVHLIRKMVRKPFCIIYTDRIEQYNLWKRRWDTIYFKHVSEFVLGDYGSYEVIEPHLYEEVLKFIETDETDSIPQQTVLTSQMVSDIEEIGILLNERLGKYQKTHPHIEGKAI